MQKQLLDPIGTICKLISLNFNKIKTKISIHDHSLTLQEPTTLQPILRMINGDERNNISELYYAIVRFIKWNSITDNEIIKKMIRYTCSACRKLQETYREGNVVLTLQFYINILDDALNDQFSDIRLPNYLIEQEKEYSNLLDYEKIKNLWSDDKLKRICEIYDNCFDVVNDKTLKPDTQQHYLDAYLQSVYIMLDAGDKEFKNLITNSRKG